MFVQQTVEVAVSGILKGNYTDIIHPSLFAGLVGYCCTYKISCFCGCRGSRAKSDKCPQVMPPEALKTGAEHYNFEDEKKSGVVEL